MARKKIKYDILYLIINIIKYEKTSCVSKIKNLDIFNSKYNKVNYYFTSEF